MNGNLNFPKILLSLSIFIFIFLGTLAFLSCDASASSISISPSALKFELYRGESSESQILITNPSQDALNFRLEAEDNPGWFSFSEHDGTLPAGSSSQITIRVNPDLDAANGEYNTFITLYLEPAEQASQLALNIAASIKAKIIISGKQVVSLQVEDITSKDSEQGMPLQFQAKLANNGNVRLSPAAEISIKKNNRLIARQSAELAELQPGSSSDMLINLSSDELEPGNYTASATILLGNKQAGVRQLNFTIYPYGTFTRAGKFLKLSIDELPKVGTVSRLTAQFSNTGSIAVRAKLISEVYLENKLVKVIASEERLVNPGETAELGSYFSPENPGSYKLISKISYEGKESKPAQLVLDVQEAKNTGLKSIRGIIISAAIVVMGLALFYSKEVWKMVGKKIEGKVYYCIDCNRPIKHKGRCMICNVTARKRLDAQERKYAN